MVWKLWVQIHYNPMENSFYEQHAQVCHICLLGGVNHTQCRTNKPLDQQLLPRGCCTKGASFFFRRGEVPNLRKVGVDKTATPPISATKILWPSHHRYTFPPKIVLKSVFLNKINTFVVILWLPIFWSSKLLWPPPPPDFSLQKFMTPPVYLGPPFQRKCQPPQS